MLGGAQTYGYSGKLNHLNSVQRFDGANWEAAPNMTTARVGLGSAVYNDNIYAIGGANANQFALNTVERFNITSGSWSDDVPAMLYKRSFFAAAVFQNKLFAIGGYDGGVNWNTVECYNETLGLWTEVEPMESVRYGLEPHTSYLYIYIWAPEN